jgi:hypothetical protein
VVPLERSPNPGFQKSLQLPVRQLSFDFVQQVGIRKCAIGAPVETETGFHPVPSDFVVHLVKHALMAGFNMFHTHFSGAKA